MAKNGQQRNYMQVVIPSGGRSKHGSEMALFNGLDLRDIPDNMCLTECENIDVSRLPELVSVDNPSKLIGFGNDYGNIVGAWGYEKSLYVVFETDSKVTLSRIEGGTEAGTVTWQNSNKGENREMAVFCYYPIEIGEMAYTVTPEYRLLVYPDRKHVKANFTKDEDVKVIAPKMEYDESTTKKPSIVVENAEIINADMTIYKDGTVKLYSGSVAGAFEGFEVGVSFTDVNKKVYSGSTSVKGKFIGAETFGIFLKKVSGSTATLELRGSPPASDVASPFYVINATSSDIVHSEDVTIETGSRITKTFQVDNLSKTAKYYAYFDYNLEGSNTLRYELYFTLSDETVGGGLKIDGKLLDGNGNLVVLDVAKEYSVSYELSNGKGEAYSAFGDSAHKIKLGSSETDESLSPEFQHITVWNSRLFGMKDSVVVCSSAGTPFDWTLDSPESELDSYGLTIGGYDESHAWYSTTQANTKASGDVTAITSYDGHPVIFKDDYMHQIYGTYNPFRIQDIVAVGCVSARSICELDSVLYFASKDGIYRYSGGYPKRISDALNRPDYGSGVVCGGYDGVLYMYNPDISKNLIYTHCPANGMWSAIKNPHGADEVLIFAVNDDGLYSVGADKKIFKYPKSNENGGTSKWSFKTNCILNSSAEDKRIHSVSVVAQGDDINIKITSDSAYKGDLGNYVEIKKDSLYGIDKLRALIRKSDSLFHRLKGSGEGSIRIHRIDVTYSYSGKRYI